MICISVHHGLPSTLNPSSLSATIFSPLKVTEMRWAIEVFFADSKRLLGLSECSAQDFASQIAHISLVMIR
ncbi:MAG: hypothetical protein SNG27_06355, partial [Rikenellaceae bacterium]